MLRSSFGRPTSHSSLIVLDAQSDTHTYDRVTKQKNLLTNILWFVIAPAAPPEPHRPPRCGDGDVPERMCPPRGGGALTLSSTVSSICTQRTAMGLALLLSLDTAVSAPAARRAATRIYSSLGLCGSASGARDRIVYDSYGIIHASARAHAISHCTLAITGPSSLRVRAASL